MNVLHIGPGNKVRKGDIVLERRSPVECGFSKDFSHDWILGDARAIPFRDDSIDGVVARKMLEHVPWGEIDLVLSEWARVLRSGGQLEVVVPDMEFYCRRILTSFAEDQEKTIQWLYGRQEYPEDYHRSGFTRGTLRRALNKTKAFKHWWIDSLPLRHLHGAYIRMRMIRR